MERVIIIAVILLCHVLLVGQVGTDAIHLNNEKIEANEKENLELVRTNERLMSEQLKQELKTLGLPSDIGQEHAGHVFEYSEEHEQAKWVGHVISTEIANRKYERSNAFRPDPSIPSESAVEEDYFLKALGESGDIEYDGYGYDRGHLAPSGDFRWNLDAERDSYYYSNMSPMKPEFNQGVWGNLEAALRRYVEINEVPLYVYAIPIFHSTKTISERSINQVSIPRAFAKVAYDDVNKRGIAFYLEHEGSDKLLQTFVKSIDDIEAMVGLDFFNKLDDKKEAKIESSPNVLDWVAALDKGDVAPIDVDLMPTGKNYINTESVIYNIGNKMTVCGTVVGVFSGKKNYLINMDLNYPRTQFNGVIWKSSMEDFDYDPEVYLKNKQICITGKIAEYREKPQIVIASPKQITMFKPSKK